tara:strand:+ start:589 stop:1302 length:714 start_codon:yes stop_codon:yes gene_type:complete
MIFVQLGAGVGDRDPSSKYRDGFTELVKKIDDSEKKTYCVEANPKNIEKLKECWKNFSNVKIFNFAIVPDYMNDDFIEFYYADEDTPYYQTFSCKLELVKKHYPLSNKINNVKVKTIKVSDFFESNFQKKNIDYLSIDIEGLDFEILKNLDLNSYNITNISFEYLHLTRKEKKIIINKLNSHGYSYFGFGIDLNNFDYLFVKKKKILNRLISKIIPFISNKHLKFLNYLISNNNKLI